MIYRKLMQAAGAGGGGDWVTDLANASYDDVSLLLVGEAVPSAIVFNDDGTRLYYTGYIGDRVRSYSLATGFDLNTAVSDGTFFVVSGQENQPRGLAFNADFSKMYIVGQSNDTVFQYSLSTPGDITTASYDNVSFSVASQTTTPEAVIFGSGGLKMYIITRTNADIFQYSLSAPFDITTALYDSISFSVGGQDTSPYGAAFSGDGSKLYVIGDSGDSVYQYTLSTPFELGSASYDGVSFSVGGQESFPTSVAFNTDGSKMYIVGPSTDTVYQYSTA